ncbi:unnamed protein product [Fraxinus pennsylvanica]|uniref:WRKY domain-containing protein n=1 Tax=Fraxinus pennsylvanica TaxID=56036 RepID=A0AAD1ZV36_9LAMI|nr:unnamed protein product [Fraxinus pennsylvanica]
MEIGLRKADLGEMVKEENKAAESDGDERGSAEKIVLQDYRLERKKAEMGKVIEENQRLKMYLELILKDYRALQMQYKDFVQQEPKKSTSASAVNIHQNTEGSELMSLSLGISSSSDRKNDKTYSITKRKVDGEDKAGLALGLICKFKGPKTTPAESSTNNLSSENSIEEVKKEAMKIWPQNKFPNTVKNREHEVSLQNLTKRPRVSVRVRCDTPTMDDGCRWRKYGQKISKGNPRPRAYYRCAVAPSCPVRKQVQRCVDNMSILLTYEGIHNHPLPVSATAMASTTSAAASMLISGSKTSISGTNFNGLNFYYPNSPISSSPLCPSITLDLTPTSFPSSSLSHLSRLHNFTQTHSTTNFNFTSLDTNAFPISWTNGIHNYGNQHCSNKNQICSFNFGAQPQETLHWQSLSSQDTIAAATKAITLNPRFQSALSAALTSVIGSGSAQQGNQTLADNKSSQNTKSSEPFPVLSSFLSAANANKCALNFLDKSHDRDHLI